ncbi:MAG: GTPase HflX [Gemmatimonas sp.]|nr:GTPase HflX [Gemmatimonas sp.]
MWGGERPGVSNPGGPALNEKSATPRDHTLPDTRQRVVLVGADLPEHYGTAIGGPADLHELGLLVDTAGGLIVGTVHQKREKPEARTFIGKGKLEELRAVVEATGANLVVFDNELSPAQGRNLTKELGGKDKKEKKDKFAPPPVGPDGSPIRKTRVRSAVETGDKVSVIDRTELILDIFAMHARTRQARLQVEMAQLQYQLPRLVKLWSHLERQAGGIGTRGPGETQLETDRRLVKMRMAHLKKELLAIDEAREVQTRRRREQFAVSLVGYTNAGKSTLMNGITGAGVLVEDKLFATLDATTRRVEIDERRQFLLSDTVGFIRRLPHHLVESFRATLQEVAESDLLLHVVDASHPDPEHPIAAVDEVLGELAPDGLPTLMVFNKMDRVPAELAETLRNQFGRRYEGALFVSALDPAGCAAVREAVESRLLAGERVVRLEVPYTRMDLVAVFHRTGSVLEEEHGEHGVRLAVRLKEEELSRLLGRDSGVKVIA